MGCCCAVKGPHSGGDAREAHAQENDGVAVVAPVQRIHTLRRPFCNWRRETCGRIAPCVVDITRRRGRVVAC
jgi:hypothetical protein